jgi:hypothetical protein
MEEWGHEFKRGVYFLPNEWVNFMWRNNDRAQFKFGVWDLLRFKVEFTH